MRSECSSAVDRPQVLRDLHLIEDTVRRRLHLVLVSAPTPFDSISTRCAGGGYGVSCLMTNN